MFQLRAKKIEQSAQPTQQQAKPEMEKVIVSNLPPVANDSIISIFGNLHDILEGDFVANILVTETEMKILSASKIAQGEK